MYRVKITAIVIAILFVVTVGAQAFDYKSYPPGDMDKILTRPKPKTGYDITDFEKCALTVTLESYAETNCGLAGIVKMTMLPSLFPKNSHVIAAQRNMKVSF